MRKRWRSGNESDIHFTESLMLVQDGSVEKLADSIEYATQLWCVATANQSFRLGFQVDAAGRRFCLKVIFDGGMTDRVQ